jgi:putative tryptophan/tyrosine transport system substrate-binding protein
VIDRRTFLAGTGAVFLAAPLAVEAQQTGKVWRIGILAPGIPQDPSRSPFLQPLRDLGYVENQNLVVERRYAEGKIDRLPDLAAELVQLKVDVIFTVSTPGVQAAQKATRTIPIVFVGVSDPVGSGVVPSLARPGANVTGVSTQSLDLPGKGLQLLKELMPRARRVAVLWNPSNRASAEALAEAERHAPSLNVKIMPVGIPSPADIETALVAITQDRPDALQVQATAPMFELRRRIMEFAASNRVPTVSFQREMAESGGLMSYGPSQVDMYRRVAAYVDKILKGAKPSDLPIEQPTKFELVINLKTAKALGLTIPPSLLGRADEVIQ